MVRKFSQSWSSLKTAFIPARGNMIHRAGELYAKRTVHVASIAKPKQYVNATRPDLDPMLQRIVMWLFFS